MDWIRESNLIEDIDDPTEDARSLAAWEWVKDKPLNIRNILRVHREITRKQLPLSECGYFRKCGVWIAGHPGAQWWKVPDLMHDWVIQSALPGGDNQEAWIKAAHIAFEKIHPFVDGNGRTGRMIMNHQRVTAGLQPLCILASERQDYYRWFWDLK